MNIFSRYFKKRKLNQLLTNPDIVYAMLNACLNNNGRCNFGDHYLEYNSFENSIELVSEKYGSLFKYELSATTYGMHIIQPYKYDYSTFEYVYELMINLEKFHNEKNSDY